MRIPEIQRILTQEPLCITPAAHASLLKVFEDHATLPRAEFNAQRQGTDMCGDAVEVEQAEVIDGIMHLPIGGPIGRGLSDWEKGAGCVDCQDIVDELRQMETDPYCRGCILIVDSPGGMVQGIAGVAAAVMACEKPVMAYTAGQMCSAAYWIGSCCDAVFSTVDADVGSIGAYCYLLDQSERYKMAGVKPVLITSGAMKGMGAPGLSLTQAQLDFLQQRIDDIAETFKTHVEEMRSGSVSREDMQGQVYPGAKALTLGFVDDIVGDLSDVVALI